MDLPMLKVSAPELVSGVSGESEQKLRELFELAVVRPLKLSTHTVTVWVGFTGPPPLHGTL